MTGYGSLPYGSGPFGGAAEKPNTYGNDQYGRATYGPRRTVSPFPAVVRDLPSGRFYVEPRIWKSDMYQTRLEEVTPALPVRATMTYNEDFEQKRQFSIDVVNPDALVPLQDFIVPELYVVDGYGNELVIPLGHYLVTPPNVTMTPTLRTGSIEGKDLTYLLGRTALPGPYLVVAGTDTGAAARDVLLRFGIISRMVDIPDSGAYLPSDRKWEAGATLIEVANDLLVAGGQYALSTSGLGVLWTKKYVGDLAAVAPSARYDTGPGNRLVPPLTDTPDWSRLRNRVIVRNLRPDGPPIVGRAEILDQSSPLHPVTLQTRLGAAAPVYFSLTEDNSDVVDQASADLRAAGLLSEGASFYHSMELETLVDPYLEGHLVVGLDIADGDDHYYTGNWLQRAFTVEMVGAKVTVKRTLAQTMRWQ